MLPSVSAGQSAAHPEDVSGGSLLSEQPFTYIGLVFSLQRYCMHDIYLMCIMGRYLNVFSE